MKKLFITFVTIGLYLVTIFGGKYLLNQGQVAGVSTETETNAIVQGLVVPHHELASPLIIQAIDEISKHNNTYSSIIIFGPNHTGTQEQPITTNTSLANLQIEETVIKKAISELDFVYEDPEYMEYEHSLIIPGQHIAEKFPEAKILPFAISPLLSDEMVDEFVQWLNQNVKGNSLAVLSVDFSHNNSLDTALDSHQTSKEVLRNFDYPLLKTLDDNFLDAPIPATVFLKTMQSQRATNFTLLEESHGALLLNKPDLKGTSYITGFFSRSEVK